MKEPFKIPNFVPCGKCDNGYIITRDNGSEIAEDCECKIAWQKKAYTSIYLNKGNIPLSILSYDINNYIGPDSNNNINKLTMYINKFSKKFYNTILYLYGDIGTQKTTLVYWVARELILNNISVQYQLMNQLMIDLQEDRFNEEINNDKYYNCDCLIIDRAFESEQLTLYKSGYQIPFIDSFLRQRIDVKQKAIIFVSNVKYTEISKHGFNRDIEDLITRKVKPYNMALEFIDHYTLKENFTDLWSE